MFGFTNFQRAFAAPKQCRNAHHWMQPMQNYIGPMKRDSDTSPLLKYIYMSSAGVAAKEKFIETCRKNFLVYIATIELGIENASASSSDAGSPRGECSHMPDCASVHTDSKRNLDSQSELSSSYVPKNRKKRGPDQRKRESNSKIYKFFKRIIPSKSSRSKANTSSMDEMYIRDFSYSEENHNLGKETNMNMEGPGKLMQYMAPISLLEHTSIGEGTNAETMREINVLSEQIEESETYIRSTLIKYIQDKSVAKDLLHAVTTHGRLLGDIEKRTNDLSNEQWIQQVEHYKYQQNTLQTSMNSIIHQNRELLEENEMLSRKNEKLSAAIVNLQETCTTNPKSPRCKLPSRHILEDLSRNNDRLRHKVNTMLNQVGNMEETVKKFQKRCNFLQQQLNNANTQVHNAKVHSEKMKTDFEMHVAKLTTELHNATSLIKDSTDQGNIIMQDMEMLKIQLKPIAKSINWDKFQKLARPLPEILHLNRMCINELSSALIYKQKELNAATTEVETLNFANCNLEPQKEEIQQLRSKLSEATGTEKSLTGEIQSFKDQLSTAEHKIDSLTSVIADKDNDIESKLSAVDERDNEINSLNELILNAKKELSQLQFNSDKLRHENNALHIQVKGMAQVLTATGAGDIAKELANSQEKLTVVQTQFFALAAENNIMLKQIETNKSERQTLVSYQKNCYEQLQILHKNIESLEKTNDTLKEQLENEKQTVNALQTERVRHLEERTILTAIYERLKSEINKVDQLEGAVSTMNKKASKLALIAEYNKQLGEKLQSEVAEKDVAINELQKNVSQLNSFQMESTKEKVALCEELNKVFSVKEVLNTKLTAELEKNVILDESKKEIQNNANLQLKEIQAAYNREHAALKNLVKDVKQLGAERDSLAEAQKESESKCIHLMLEHEKLVDFIKTLQVECKVKQEKLDDLLMHMEKQSIELEKVKETKECEIGYIKKNYEITINQIDSMQAENDALKSSLDYLQHDIAKIRTELETSRQNENEYKKSMDELQNTYNELYEDYRSKTSALQQIIEENEALKINVYSLGEKFKCLTEENERMSQDSLRLETMIAEKFQTTKIAGHPTPKHVENVLDDINARDEEILVLQDRLREHEERSMEMNDLLQTVSENRKQFELGNQQLQQELDTTILELHNQRQRGDKLENIIDELQQNTITLNEFEEQHKRFASTLEGIKNQYETQLQTVEHEISHVRKQNLQLHADLEDVTGNIEQYKEAHEKLQKAHKILALKLFTAVRVLICEKVALETSQSKINGLDHERQRLIKFTEQHETEVNHLRDQINQYQQELDETKCENASLFDDITSTRAIVSDLQDQLETISKSNNGISEEAKKEQEQCIATLKSQLDDSRKSADKLQTIIAKLESNSTSMEFEKSEIELRLHELQMQTQSEIARCNEMKRIMQNTLSLIIELKEHGRISPHVHNQLLQSFSDVE